MESYTTEEQQVEALKKWWDENGRVVLLGLIVGLAAVFGWRSWTDYRQGVAEQASAAYQNLLGSVEQGETREVIERGRKIIADYPNSPYAVLASLSMAQRAVDEGDLEGAAAHLRWAMDNTGLPEIEQLARLRLARVLLSQDKPAEALALLERGVGDEFAALVAETRGDIHVAMGEVDKARAAYTEALEGYADTPSKQPLLRMKLDDLAAAAAEAQ